MFSEPFAKGEGESRPFQKRRGEDELFKGDTLYAGESPLGVCPRSQREVVSGIILASSTLVVWFQLGELRLCAMGLTSESGRVPAPRPILALGLVGDHRAEEVAVINKRKGISGTSKPLLNYAQ